MEMLTKLQLLRLDQNDIESDTFTGSLPQSLQQLHLRSNHLTLLPPAIIVLKQLTLLDLSNNRLEDVGGVECLVALKVLLLDNNQIKELPLRMEMLVNIQHISLQYNQIERLAVSREGQSIPSELLISTPLERLDLKGNPLRQVEIMSFDGIDVFLERRREGKDKALQGGAMVDMSLFGLD